MALYRSFMDFIRQPNVSLIIDIVILLFLTSNIIHYIQQRQWLSVVINVILFAYIGYNVGQNIAKRQR